MTGPDRLSWRDVRSEIHEAILEGRYAPGDRLPRDADIAAELNCARSTVQRAMQDLADSGLIERRRKGGTRVRPDPITRATLDIPITRLEVEAQGAAYGYRLLATSRSEPPPDVRETFGTDDMPKALHVEAMHLADGRPYILEDRWINLATAAEIQEIDLSVHSANEWLVHNKPYTRVDLRLGAQAADARLAEHMDTETGAALFVMVRTTWIESAPITTVTSFAAPGYQLITRNEA